MGCCADALGLCDDEAAAVDVSVCRADKSTAYVAADGRIDSSDCAVAFTAVAFREAIGLSSWLQQMLIWSAVSVQVSLDVVSYILNDDYRAIWTLANLDFKQQKVLAPDEQACWPPEGVVLSPPSQPELGPQQTASVFPGSQQ
jgi:hypothetical protein